MVDEKDYALCVRSIVDTAFKAWGQDGVRRVCEIVDVERRSTARARS